MKNNILAVILSSIMTLATQNIAKADSIVLPEGTITGKINYILGDLVEIQTLEGLKTITRNTSDHKDIVIAGTLKKSKITGNIFYLDSNTVEVNTSSGSLKLSRFSAKEIIISK